MTTTAHHSNIDLEYQKLIKHILDNGENVEPARIGLAGTRKIFGYQYKVDLLDNNNNFILPMITVNALKFADLTTELDWFISGDTNIKFLVDRGCNFWTDDAYAYYCNKFKKNDKTPKDFNVWKASIGLKTDIIEDVNKITHTYGDCGSQYGKIWRGIKSGDIDQLYTLIDNINKNPTSRRHLLVSDLPNERENLALYWCHSLFQVNCTEIDPVTRLKLWSKKMKHSETFADSYLSNHSIEQVSAYCELLGAPKYYIDGHLYQRSADVMLGVPYNTASYSLLLNFIANITNMIPRRFIHSFGDVHIYNDHILKAKIILDRKPKILPKLIIKKDLKNYDIKDSLTLIKQEGLVSIFKLINYNPELRINFKLHTQAKK